MNPDPKIDVLLTCYDALKTLDTESQKCVISQLASRLGGVKTSDLSIKPKAPNERMLPHAEKPSDSSGAPDDGFAVAFSKANPKTEDHKVLFAAWFLFGRIETQEFRGIQVSKRLTQTGHGVNSVSVCLGRLKHLKPALIVQVRSTGNKRQSRKIYRLTDEGVKTARQMLESPSE
ncbi:MAG: hypothetical protein ABSG04_13665 [Verrucomicrobiota bacterium]